MTHDSCIHDVRPLSMRTHSLRVEDTFSETLHVNTYIRTYVSMHVYTRMFHTQVPFYDNPFYENTFSEGELGELFEGGRQANEVIFF